MDRWAIYVDIEGTSRIFAEEELRFFRAFDALLNAIYVIGTKVYPETPNRLFAHQLGGDGLIIVSEFVEGGIDLPISIATLLLQILLTNDAVGKGGISKGRFADIHDCFPSLRHMTESTHNVYDLGRGILSIFPVMGTALINAHRLASPPHVPSGGILAVDRNFLKTPRPGVLMTKEEADFVIVDWIHTRTQVMEDILLKSGLEIPAPHELERRLIDYVCNSAPLCEAEWGRNSLSLNGCHRQSNHETARTDNEP